MRNEHGVVEFEQPGVHRGLLLEHVEAGTGDDAAIERVVAGLEKSTRIIPEEEKRRVAYHEIGHALGACTLPSPQLLLLDEPTAGVDPKARRDFWEEIHALSAAGLTVLVSTHYMDEAEYCHRVSIMVDGVIRALDTPAALKRQFGAASMDEVFYTLARTAQRGAD